MLMAVVTFACTRAKSAAASFEHTHEKMLLFRGLGQTKPDQATAFFSGYSQWFDAFFCKWFFSVGKTAVLYQISGMNSFTVSQVSNSHYDTQHLK